MLRISLRQHDTNEVLDYVEISPSVFVSEDAKEAAILRTLIAQLGGPWILSVGDSITIDEY